MTEISRRLEIEVQAPPCWVFTSHLTVVFCRSDVAVHPQSLDEAFLFDLSYGWIVSDRSCGDVDAFVVQDYANKRYQLATIDEDIQIITVALREAGIVKSGEEGESGAR